MTIPIPLGLLGSEPDMRPWEVLCSEHGIQVGRLVDEKHFGEASNRGVCEACLIAYHVRCKEHGVQPRGEWGRCPVCNEEAARTAEAAGAGGPTAVGGAARVDEVPFNLPVPGLPAGGDHEVATVLAVEDAGPAVFGGLPDGAGGWSRPGEVHGGPGGGAAAGAAAGPAGGRPGPAARPEAAAPGEEVVEVRPVPQAGPQSTELPLGDLIRRALAARARSGVGGA